MKKKMLDFDNSCVLVIGDIILDRYWYSKNNYVLSEQLTPILKINKIIEQPGGAANVAKNIAEIGGLTKIIGLIGMDHEGLILQKLLNHTRICSDLITIKNNKTITKIRIASTSKQFLRADFQEKYVYKKNHLLFKKIVNSLVHFKILVLSDYAKGTLVNIKKIIKLAKHMSIPTLIDPKGTDFTKYSGAHLLTPNISEFEKIVGKCYEEADILKKGKKLLSTLKLSALLVTRSSHGMTLFQKNKKIIHFPAISNKSSDVIGAGDTVIAIIAVSLEKGYSLEESCFYANIGASIVIQKVGTETITVNELNQFLHHE